jgi:hypothetical protein
MRGDLRVSVSLAINHASVRNDGYGCAWNAFVPELSANQSIYLSLLVSRKVRRSLCVQWQSRQRQRETGKAAQHNPSGEWHGDPEKMQDSSAWRPADP